MTRRLPIRLRVATTFALTTAVALLALGLFVYYRVEATLTGQTRSSLEVQLSALTHVPAANRAAVATDLTGESFAEVLDGNGAVLASSPLLGGRLLSGGDIRDLGRARESQLERKVLLENELEPALLLVQRRDDQVLVVGRSLEDVQDALAGVRTQLLIGGPVALLLASVAGYVVAGSALRPMERMRRQAAAISARHSGERLALTPAHDELRRLAQTLNAMLDRLESTLLRERRFIAEASHELRTPLALLRVELDLALARPRPPDELRAALVSASEEAERLTRLAEELLLVAAAGEDRPPSCLSEVELGGLLHGLAARFAARADTEHRGIRVGGEFPLLLTTDRDRLDQALSNLVDNALRHGAGDIEVCARNRGETVSISVKDHGHGVAPDVRARSFEPFGRGPGPAAQSRPGLGLAIIRALADRLGGTVSLNGGNPAEGATFTITLPTSLR